MSDELNSIGSSCGETNLSGIPFFEYLPIEWIESFPEFIDDDNTITTAVVVIPGKQWLTMDQIIKSIDYREPQRDSPQKPFYNQIFNVDVSQDIPEKNNQFNIMKNHRFIIRYTNSNGYVKLLGSPEYPFKFKADLNSGKKTGSFSGHKIKFESQNPQKAPFYSV